LVLLRCPYCDTEIAWNFPTELDDPETPVIHYCPHCGGACLIAQSENNANQYGIEKYQPNPTLEQMKYGED